MGDGKLFASHFILPVFAGMIPPHPHRGHGHGHSPRIRGDDPRHGLDTELHHAILPVFAGMIPALHDPGHRLHDSPRIRGDDPVAAARKPHLWQFSPYSRG